MRHRGIEQLAVLVRHAEHPGDPFLVDPLESSSVRVGPQGIDQWPSGIACRFHGCFSSSGRAVGHGGNPSTHEETRTSLPTLLVLVFAMDSSAALMLLGFGFWCRCVDHCAGDGAAGRVNQSLGVASLVEIGQQTGLRRRPFQFSPRLRARCTHVETDKRRKPAEKRAGLIRSDGLDRQVQASTDRPRDVTQRHTFFCHRMVFRAGLGLFERQPVKAGGIEYMHGGPAIEP
ncbi:MAG: hypothetical protein ACREPL_03925, partial [Rhodanobacteraceae bacterium]